MCDPYNGHSFLTTEEPEHHGQQNAEEQAGGNWDIDREILALDEKVARQPPQADACKPRPENTDRDDNKPNYDEDSRHGTRCYTTSVE